MIDFLHDAVLTVTISVQLYRSKTGWKGTDELIQKVLMCVVSPFVLRSGSAGNSIIELIVRSFAEAQVPPTLM